MIICEEFDTIQGEGRYIGVPSRFIRTTGCNLRCAWKNLDGTITRCDTPYTSWTPEKGWSLNPKKTLESITETSITHVVITGGEPTLQVDLPDVCYYFTNKGLNVTLETNGTRYYALKGVFVSLSPKLKSSYAATGSNKGVHTSNNSFMGGLKSWIMTNDYQLKFVVNEPEDITEILDIKTRLNAPSNKIFLMPQGINKKQFNERKDFILIACLEYGFNYTPRMHIELWGNKRGK